MRTGEQCQDLTAIYFSFFFLPHRFFQNCKYNNW